MTRPDPTNPLGLKHGPQREQVADDSFLTAPCGCSFGQVGDAFVINPCSLTCDLYLYAAAEAEKVHGQAPTMVDLRTQP